METIITIKPVVAVLISLFASLLIMATPKKPNLRETWSVLGAVATFLTILSMMPLILSGKALEYTPFVILPGISLKFRVDALGLIFGIIASFLWILVTFYNIGYMRSLKEHAQTRYYTCFALAIFGAIGVAFSGNLFTLYLFYELITIFTYPLVSHHQDEESYEGARKYMVYLTGTAKSFFLPAIVLTYILAGTLDFAPSGIMHGIFPETANPTLVTITYILYLAGFAKAALMPFHNWLPSAMVAPTPVSALLHAVAVVKAGVFCTSRVMLSVFGVELMNSLNLGIPTAYLASFTILMASIIALTKDDLKARLAYSTVSQLSYVILGVALLTPSGVTGGLIHIANHAFSKITLFMCAGSIYVSLHTKKISEMGGIAKQMPFTIAAFSIAALSMIGVPLVCGFVTKWYLAIGTMQAHNTILLVVLLASTILNTAYFFPVIIKTIFGKPREGDPGALHSGRHEAPAVMVIPLLLTATASVLMGLYPDFFMNIVKSFDPDYLMNTIKAVLTL
ncbi:MAG: monovalent cation/H+ antiporter subunit D family protein [Proteobacteria bacterium]|nr:monovalent cation/H+ antiporter subunit D family protein [Pseudomonadota bacterium]